MGNKKQILLWCGGALLLSLFLNSLGIYANYHAVSKNGSEVMFGSEIFLVLLLMVAIVSIPISLIGLIFKKTRIVCFIIILCVIIYFGTTMGCLRLSGKVRMAAFHGLAKRSEPLVQAIKDYELKYGSPPVALENLVPEFLPNVPQTGMGAYPEYEYKVGDDANDFAKETWYLFVYTPLAGFNWDIFIYFPSQNYPEYGYGGVLEKVEDWAYVHE